MNKLKLFFSLILFKTTGTWSLRKSLWFNFRYLPFCQAIHLPVLLSRNELPMLTMLLQIKHT